MAKKKPQTESTEVVESNVTHDEHGNQVVPGLEKPRNSGDKYNSIDKRGPVQGIGAFCRELIAEGKTNAEVLIAVQEKFPTAKTSKSCVAFYRAKMLKARKDSEVALVQAEVALVQAEAEAEAEAAAF